MSRRKLGGRQANKTIRNEIQGLNATQPVQAGLCESPLSCIPCDVSGISKSYALKIRHDILITDTHKIGGCANEKKEKNVDLKHPHKQERCYYSVRK